MSVCGLIVQHKHHSSQEHTAQTHTLARYQKLANGRNPGPKLAGRKKPNISTPHTEGAPPISGVLYGEKIYRLARNEK